LEAEILKIEPLCTAITSFYTIRFEGKELSEFSDFYHRMKSNSDNHYELELIMAIIQEVGNRGAQRRYFNRPEKMHMRFHQKAKSSLLRQEIMESDCIV
jgi:hypothetical protein